MRRFISIKRIPKCTLGGTPAEHEELARTTEMSPEIRLGILADELKLDGMPEIIEYTKDYGLLDKLAFLLAYKRALKSTNPVDCDGAFAEAKKGFRDPNS